MENDIIHLSNVGSIINEHKNDCAVGCTRGNYGV
jgi:hypothetical protein